jgi:hypothetical protein
MNRITKDIKKNILSYSDSEDRMIEIIDILNETEFIPDVGSFYTFIYSPKTAEIEYDQHPLVVVTEIYRWGFRGFNFHWPGPHNYTWTEIAGKLHKVYKEELNTLISIGYQKFRINI